MWIYEYKNWPNFTWKSDKLISNLADIRYKQGVFISKIKELGFKLENEAKLNALTDNIVKSWAIEGEKLDSEEVRSSVARRLNIETAGITPVSRNIDSIVEMMLDAMQQFSEPLTEERLFRWHSILFPTGRNEMGHRIKVANWRPDAISVLSGPMGREKIYFDAPSADKVEREMQVFLSWFNTQQEINPLLKVGIAHLWFVSIHPFEDGNGRITRAISDMLLASAEGSSDRFYSLSSQIESEKNDYYNQLEKQQRSSPEITPWLEWFLACLGRAISSAETKFQGVIFKGQLWKHINQQGSVNPRQKSIINRMLENFKGHMHTSKYAKITKCSNITALRDIQDLKKRGILLKNPGSGRSTSYRLIDKIE